MRHFKISVDGVSYNVTVEEMEPDAKGKTEPKPETVAAAPVASTPAATSMPSPPRATPPATSAPPGSGDVVSPMAGTVIEVKVSAGQTVKSGEEVLVLEAMKMESVLVAPIDGRVQNIAVTSGQSVQEGQTLLSLTPV